MAQVLGKSSCCMHAYILTLHWLRHSGNPPCICRNMFWNSTGSDTREILLLYLLIYSDNPLAQILGISPCSMQEYALKVCWLRYSGNPPAVCMHILWHLTGSDTREILLLLYAGICFKSVLAQILGKSCCCMQVYILKIIWLRYSGNPAAVWINIFWHSTGSDTR